MTWVDTSLVFLIVSFLLLLIWSRIQQQQMLDTLGEIRDFVRSLKE